MSLTTLNADEEALRAELRKKEHDLLLAARYGKTLLEENDLLRKDLENARQEQANVIELLEAQKHEAQRSFLESKQTTEQHMSELEQQVIELRNELAKERTTILTLKDDSHRSLKYLQTENSQLRDNLSKALQELNEEKTTHKELNKKLGESKRREQKQTFELAELQKQLEIVQGSNKSFSVDISTLVSTCDQLTTELNNCREEVEYWEKRYCDKDEELNTCSKDLGDSQELLKQLQLELEQQSSGTPKSVRSSSRSASLYDELCSSRDSLALSYMGIIHTEDTSSTCVSDLVEHEHTCIASDGPCYNGSSPLLHNRESRLMVLPENSSEKVRCGWEDEVFHCERCQDMERKLASSEEELKLVNAQLMMAVEQKFKLQEQIEAWQTDMTQVVQQQIQQKLIKGTLSSKKRNSKKSKSKHDSPEHRLSYHMIKDSWVF